MDKETSDPDESGEGAGGNACLIQWGHYNLESGT